MQRESEQATAGGMSGRSAALRPAPACRDAVAAGVRGGRRLSCGIPLVPLNPGESRFRFTLHVPPAERTPGRRP